MIGARVYVTHSHFYFMIYYFKNVTYQYNCSAIFKYPFFILHKKTFHVLNLPVKYHCFASSNERATVFKFKHFLNCSDRTKRVSLFAGTIYQRQ